jgi:septal ring factor EnvC (AmiA/AmiB activator)
MKKTIFVLVTAFSAFTGCTSNNQSSNSTRIDQLQKKVTELEQRIEDTKPSLSGIMSGIQRHHAKLYYSGVRGNWKLAGYELTEIKEAIARSATSYTNAKTGPEEMKSGIDALSSSIRNRNIEEFASNFDKLTVSCNQCHQNREHDFIVIKIPGPGMFTDQTFR